MAAIVGIDAYIVVSSNVDTPSWETLPERNEFSISIKVDTAEHKIFVANLASAWSDKKRTWMSWSGSINGYLDDADDTIFTKVTLGQVLLVRFYDSRDGQSIDGGTKLPTPGGLPYWEGKIILTSIEHGTGTSDFSTLNVSFDGVGALTRN